MTIDDYAAKYGEDYPFVKMYKTSPQNILHGLDLYTLHIGYLWGQIAAAEEEHKRLKTELGESNG